MRCLSLTIAFTNLGRNRDDVNVRSYACGNGETHANSATTKNNKYKFFIAVKRVDKLRLSSKDGCLRMNLKYKISGMQ